MKRGVIVKTVILVALLVLASAPLGVVCRRVSGQYEVLFSPGQELLNLAIWALGTMALIVLAAGLLVALVRPLWVIAVGFVLSALVLILVWQISIVSMALGLVYFVLAMAYARSVVDELNERLRFSIGPISQGQGTLLLALTLLVGTSFALGYREDAARRGFIVPPAYKQTVVQTIVPQMQPLMGSRDQLGPLEKSVVEEEIKREVERFWAEIETALQPYASLVPIGLALILIWALQTLLSFVSWVPTLLLNGIFPLLKVLGVTQVITETREVSQLTLS